MGGPATVELRVDDPARPDLPPVFVTLGRPVPREPRIVCLGTYAGNQTPADGDVGCQVRGREPLVLTLQYDFVPGKLSDFAVRHRLRPGKRTGHAPAADRSRATAIAAALGTRLFLATFSSSATGVFTLRAYLADGSTFTHPFTLPLSRREAGSWPGFRRRGALFNEGIGENIVNESYDQIIRRFGPPLTTSTNPGGVRCIYYDVIGYETGWTFCFHGQGMVGAAGNQRPPASGH